jgi:ribose-phosphate pyrophosphokinase
MPTFFDTVFDDTIDPVAPIGLIISKGAEELGVSIDRYLVEWYNQDIVKKSNKFKKDTFIIDTDFPRFTTGDGKAIINETVRGKDLYILVDVGNYSKKYSLYGVENSYSPDDHFANLKRVISAAGGKPERITVIMPMLYAGRQHKRSNRESLDCAQALQELYTMGVSDIITFDAHDPRVQNAVPLMGFDNFYPTYQILKVVYNQFKDIDFLGGNFMIVSPDEGAMPRNIYYASVLGVDLGMYYKRRDYATVIDGRNRIVAHEYLGTDVAGKDIFVADDIIATGDSMLRLCSDLKERGARKIILACTYSLFTEGFERFDLAYEQGLFTAVIGTNLTYRKPELLAKKWYAEADCSKYIAYIIASCNHNKSVSPLLNSAERIHELIGR